MSRTRSFAVIAATYVVAAVVAVAIVVGADWHPAAEIAVSYAAATAVTYVVIRLTGNGSVFDAYWSVIPPVVGVALAVGADGANGARQVLLLVIFALWGVRLTYNWAMGWPGLHHEDWRYVMFKQKGVMPAAAVDATVVTGFPTVQLVLGSLPFVPALVRGDGAFGWVDIVAAAVMGGALVIETVADEQLRAFVRSDPGPGAILDTGLWAHVRHPNYLGELGVWLGLFLFGLAADPGYWWTGVGFVAMWAMFVFASIPMLDERSVERRPGYDEHMRRVPALLPRPRR